MFISKRSLGMIVFLLLIATAVLPATGKFNYIKSKNFLKEYSDEPLPDPISIDMILEESICRRMSVRDFTTEQVTDEELSTVLWAAYGYTDDGKRGIFNPDEIYSTIIYVIRSDATYKYVPETHSLSLFKSGNYLHLGMYDNAPIKFGLVWDKSVSSDELYGMSEIGMIGQNIYFNANALDLGTVTTAMYADDLYQLGLPSNEKSEIIMPLGHPSPSYDFTYSPLPPSNLPSIVNNIYSLEDSINYRIIGNTFDNTPLTELEQSQLIWSSYGYSYYLDDSNDRHQTVPSAMGVYPFKIYAANQDGVYLYNPGSHSITTVIQGDRREEINNSLGQSNIWTASASWIIIPFYNSLQNPERLIWWYYEVGAISHNVILEATALNLTSNIITDISDVSGLRSALGISSQTNLQPWFVIPVGHPYIEAPNNPPETPDLSGPTSGKPDIKYDYFISTNDPDLDIIFYYVDWGDETNTGWIGPYSSGEELNLNHTWPDEGTYLIKVKAKDEHGSESDWASLKVTIPRIKISSDCNLLKLLEILQNKFSNIRFIFYFI